MIEEIHPSSVMEIYPTTVSKGSASQISLASISSGDSLSETNDATAYACVGVGKLGITIEILILYIYSISIVVPTLPSLPTPTHAWVVVRI